MASEAVTDSQINEAAATLDSSTTESTTTDSTAATGPKGKDVEKEPRTMASMLAALKLHSDGTNVIKESIKTFTNIDGFAQKSDVIVADKHEAVSKLKEMIEEEKNHPRRAAKKKAKWEFKTSPHEHFGKTLDDTFAAFVQWARTSDTPVQYNVTKAFRRLASYADWMHDTGTDLTEPPLTADSIKDGLKAWSMRTSIDKNENFVWWVDFAKVDKAAVKSTISPRDSLRAFAWFSHYVMYDNFAQDNGVVFVENANKIGFMESMSIIPMKLGVKLDRLTVGVLPVKMKALYIMDCPGWIDMFMKLMGMFMSKKMKERVVVLKEWEKLTELLGEDCIPKDFGPLEGVMAIDPIDVKFFG